MGRKLNSPGGSQSALPEAGAAVTNLVPAVHAGNAGTGRPVAGREDGEAARGGQTVAARERAADERQASIERSRALLARSGEALERDKERLRRSQERDQCQQAEIDRASAKSARGLSALPPDSGSVIERSKQLYQQALTVIEAFAVSQERVRPSTWSRGHSRRSSRSN
jgi:hypothetical protein